MKSFKSFLNETIGHKNPKPSYGVHDEFLGRLEGSLARGSSKQNSDQPGISRKALTRNQMASAAENEDQRDAFDDHRRAYTDAKGTDNALIQAAFTAVDKNPSENKMSNLVRAAHEHSMENNPQYAEAMKSIPSKHHLAVADQYFNHRIKVHLGTRELNRGQS